MTDVTIPAGQAKAVARSLRDYTAVDRLRHGPVCGHCAALLAAADLLDPPAPSLRDEVAAAMSESWAERDGWEAAADAVFAVVRRHVEAMPLPDQPGLPVAWGNGWLAGLEDVRRLLGGSDD